MKYYLLILCMLPFKIFAQNLNYNDLTNILSETIVQSSDYLENKGYRIFNTNSNTNDNKISYIWDKHGKSNPSVSYLLITWNKSKNYKMVWYQFHSLSHYNSLLKTIESLNFKRTESYYKFESLNSIYENDTYNISISKAANHYTFSIRYQFNKLLLKEIKPKF